MLKRTNVIASGFILLWYAVGAASGWKGWALAVPVSGPGAHATGGSSGGHGSIYGGGWGGGK